MGTSDILVVVLEGDAGVEGDADNTALTSVWVWSGEW